MSVCVVDRPNDPHNRAFHFPVIQPVTAIPDFTTCLRTVSVASMSDASMDSDADQDTIPMDIDARATSDPDVSFLDLPPELRTMVYRELLLSDSAFRLGHHGPYSHEKRRQLYPQILRTCRLVFMEASEVLYGDNTFYLGPIGHKPTYSASFTTSIGAHNAVKLRTLVAHCTHVTSLNESYLRNWISAFGLGVDRLKALAISFSPNVTGESAAPPSATFGLDDQFNQPHLLHHTHRHHRIHQHHHHHSRNHQHHHFTHNHAQQHNRNSPPGQSRRAFVPFLNDGQRTQNIHQSTANPPFHPFLGPPGGNFNILRTVTQHNVSGTAPLPPATTVIGSSPVTTPGSEQQEAEKVQLDYALMESRMQSWLARVEPAQVQQWVQIKNTDLRAGQRWLLYVCPSLQAMRSLRF